MYTPWVKLTPRRAMNRKLRQAGFAARGLDEAAMCQVADDDSDGFISTDTVELLGIAHGEKRLRQLTKALEDCGRWEPVDGGWLIHDYEEFNQTKEHWSAQRQKKAAAGSRGGKAKAKASALAPATSSARAPDLPDDTTDAEPSARAPAVADALAVTVRNESQKQLQPERYSTPAGLVPAAAAAAIVDQALHQLAERRLKAKREPVPNPAGWLHGAVAGLRKDHADLLATIDPTAFDSPERLADYLEPSPVRRLDPTERTQRASHAMAARADQPPCPTCGSRGGAGWLVTDDGAVRCPDCAPQLANQGEPQ